MKASGVGMTESIHRNGCTGCDHPPEAFPLCWTEAQVSEGHARVRALVTGERLPPISPIAQRVAELDIPKKLWDDVTTAQREWRQAYDAWQARLAARCSRWPQDWP